MLYSRSNIERHSFQPGESHLNKLLVNHVKIADSHDSFPGAEDQQPVVETEIGGHIDRLKIDSSREHGSSIVHAVKRQATDLATGQLIPVSRHIACAV